MASSSVSTQTEGCCTVNFTLCGRDYHNVCLSFLPGLCADIILGQDLQQKHASVTVKYGGQLPQIVLCGLTTLHLSLQTGKFPARFKSAQVLPLLKKAGLDRSLPANYRPISNLSTVSKVLERLVLARLCPHLTNPKNFSNRPTGKDIRPRRRCSMSLTASTLRLTARRSHCSLASISLQPSTRSVTRH